MGMSENKSNLHTVFPLISAPGAYQILNLLGAAVIRGRRWFEGGAYFKVREVNNILNVKTLSFYLSK